MRFDLSTLDSGERQLPLGYLFLDMFPTLDPRCPLVNEMLLHKYTTYVSGILGLGEEQGCRRQRRQHATENLTSGGKYSVSKYTEASALQIYRRG